MPHRRWMERVLREFSIAWGFEPAQAFLDAGVSAFFSPVAVSGNMLPEGCNIL